MSDPLNLSTIDRHFSDEAEAYKLIESLRWPEGPVCPHCGSINHAYYLAPRNGERTTRKGTVSSRRLWKCAECRKQFSVLVGTIFEDSRIPMAKWLQALYLLCAAKNGMSAHELHRMVGITYKSAWFMAHRIRYAMTKNPLADKLGGIVEADETYVGGMRPGGGRGRSTKDKAAVVTLVQRDGAAHSEVVDKVDSASLGRAMRENVDPKAYLMTDGFVSYKFPGTSFASHQAVNHGRGEYVRGAAHVNSVEGYFSQLKRSIDGTYHQVSEKHLGRYLAEFDYRYSSRKVSDGDRTKQRIINVAGKRLTYKRPIGKLEN